MQTIQQQRAAYALKQVHLAEENDEIRKKEYRSYASALPAMIHINGLGQAAAFYRSKSIKNAEYKALYELLSGWLCCDDPPHQPYHGCDDLMTGITGGNMQQYRLAQAEAQALMDWVKKFASAYLQGD